MHIPEGHWTKPLTDEQRAHAEKLMQDSDFEGLDARDLVKVRHALYRAMLFQAGTTTEHRFGAPPEPVANPSPDWCDRYAEWYYQGKG